jgi:hypothetical protein
MREDDMIDYSELKQQIGHMVILSVSGGRVESTPNRNILRFPVSNGYAVEVELDPSDTYTVRRTFTRTEKGKLVRRVKGERTTVYADEISQAFYFAGMFRSYDENEWVDKR